MMTKSKILVIDDDVDICQLLESFLTRKGFDVKTAFTGKEGVALSKKSVFDLALMDFRLPDVDGYDLIRLLKNNYPSLPIIVITGYSDVKKAVKSIQLGAFEYVTKPIYPEEILLHIEQAIESKNKKSAFNEKQAVNKNQKRKLNTDENYVQGESPMAKQVRNLIDLVAPTDMTVVILGESGTGKEVAARQIHNSSKRKECPFVAVDCGALSDELAGSELFGHVKGAFTGATMDKKGHFEHAKGGTLFLDEIGNLSYENQIKLLRVLQERKVRKIGGNLDIAVDVRIIVATNEDLSKAVESGKFREDIYYRINEFKIELPTLKENTADLEKYIHFFINKANQELEKNVALKDREVISILKNYNWPGNIRELKNVLKRAVLLTTDGDLSKLVFPHEIVQKSTINNSISESDLATYNLKKVVKNAEVKAIAKALAHTKHNKSKTAELLGIDRKTLYNKLNTYGLMD